MKYKVKYKVGDKVICKKDFKSIFKKYEIYKGKYYNVLDDEGDCVVIETDKDIYGYSVSRRFYFREHESNKNLPDKYYWFEDYFYTIKEMRRNKLIKLKSIL